MFGLEKEERESADELLGFIGNRNAAKMRRQKRQIYEAMEYGPDMWKDQGSRHREVICEAN